MSTRLPPSVASSNSPHLSDKSPLQLPQSVLQTIAIDKLRCTLDFEMGEQIDEPLSFESPYFSSEDRRFIDLARQRSTYTYDRDRFRGWEAVGNGRCWNHTAAQAQGVLGEWHTLPDEPDEATRAAAKIELAEIEEDLVYRTDLFAEMINKIYDSSWINFLDGLPYRSSPSAELSREVDIGGKKFKSLSKYLEHLRKGGYSDERCMRDQATFLGRTIIVIELVGGAGKEGGSVLTLQRIRPDRRHFPDDPDFWTRLDHDIGASESTDPAYFFLSGEHWQTNPDHPLVTDLEKIFIEIGGLRNVQEEVGIPSLGEDCGRLFVNIWEEGKLEREKEEKKRREEERKKMNENMEVEFEEEEDDIECEEAKDPRSGFSRDYLKEIDDWEKLHEPEKQFTNDSDLSKGSKAQSSAAVDDSARDDSGYGSVSKDVERQDEALARAMEASSVTYEVEQNSRRSSHLSPQRSPLSPLHSPAPTSLPTRTVSLVYSYRPPLTGGETIDTGDNGLHALLRSVRRLPEFSTSGGGAVEREKLEAELRNFRASLSRLAQQTTSSTDFLLFDALESPVIVVVKDTTELEEEVVVPSRKEYLHLLENRKLVVDFELLPLVSTLLTAHVVVWMYDRRLNHLQVARYEPQPPTNFDSPLLVSLFYVESRFDTDVDCLPVEFQHLVRKIKIPLVEIPVFPDFARLELGQGSSSPVFTLCEGPPSASLGAGDVEMEDAWSLRLPGRSKTGSTSSQAVATELCLGKKSASVVRRQRPPTLAALLSTPRKSFDGRSPQTAEISRIRNAAVEEPIVEESVDRDVNVGCAIGDSQVQKETGMLHGYDETDYDECVKTFADVSETLRLLRISNYHCRTSSSERRLLTSLFMVVRDKVNTVVDAAVRQRLTEHLVEFIRSSILSRQTQRSFLMSYFRVVNQMPRGRFTATVDKTKDEVARAALPPHPKSRTGNRDASVRVEPRLASQSVLAADTIRFIGALRVDPNSSTLLSDTTRFVNAKINFDSFSSSLVTDLASVFADLSDPINYFSSKVETNDPHRFVDKRTVHFSVEAEVGQCFLRVVIGTENRGAILLAGIEDRKVVDDFHAKLERAPENFVKVVKSQGFASRFGLNVVQAFRYSCDRTEMRKASGRQAQDAAAKETQERRIVMKEVLDLDSLVVQFNFDEQETSSRSFIPDLLVPVVRMHFPLYNS